MAADIIGWCPFKHLLKRSFPDKISNGHPIKGRNGCKTIFLIFNFPFSARAYIHARSVYTLSPYRILGPAMYHLYKRKTTFSFER